MDATLYKCQTVFNIAKYDAFLLKRMIINPTHETNQFFLFATLKISSQRGEVYKMLVVIDFEIVVT